MITKESFFDKILLIISSCNGRKLSYPKVDFNIDLAFEITIKLFLNVYNRVVEVKKRSKKSQVRKFITTVQSKLLCLSLAIFIATGAALS